MKKPCLILALLFALFPAGFSAGTKEKPNIIFILTDNHGAWTLGCYGNPDIQTPNLDRMADEGMQFMKSLSTNPVCSPTRATYLTGLMPSQHGVHSFVPQHTMMGDEAYYMLEEFETLPGILHDEGYVCGLSGKWHLGANMKPHDGFSYWATMPRGGTSSLYNDPVILDGKLIGKSPKYMTDLWTERGIDFIEQNKDGDKPFFLFLSYNGPYCLSRLLLRPAKNRWAGYYADKHLPSFPRDTAHPWQYSNLDYHNNIVSIRRVAAEVSGVDDGVGEILATLERHGLDENTVVVFTGDQGWMGGQNGFFGMGDHTKPMAAHDMMMHVPLIFHHPGSIPSGKSDAVVTNCDFLPSVLEYVGLESRIPEKPKLTGKSYAPILRGEGVEWPIDMYYEMESCRSVRNERWKYVERRSPEGPGELYDLEIDPMERVNLFNQKGYEKIQKEMAEKLYAFFDKYADPEYDIWNGGRSKARRHHAPADHPDYREPKPRPWKAAVEKGEIYEK